MKGMRMFKYVAMIVGIVVMCVPEDAGFLRFAAQGLLGLVIFGIGVIDAIAEHQEQNA